MATGLPNPKSREQILSEMLTEYVGLTGVNDLNTGSVLTQFFDVVARSVARSSGDIFQVLRDYSVDRATGEALNRIGTEERVYRRTAQTASGSVTVTDTSFEKKATKIYAGASSPNIGSTVIKVSDASNFPTTGKVYLGRGTPNIEGPINYSTAPVQEGSYWKITLDSPTTKFHNISETVILGQGGTRNIPVGTALLSPGSGAVADISYTVSSSAILLDGENVNQYVQIVAQQPGSSSNAPAGSIRQFTTVPFSGATVINSLPLTTGSDDESDDDYRDRIKKQRLSKGLGTALAVKNAVLGAKASDENAVVTSNEIDTTNPAETILYIDNGRGYEEKTAGVGIEFVVDSAVGGERSFQLATGGKQTSIAKAFLLSSESSPFAINPLDRLSILVGGLVSEHIFNEGDFKAAGSATAYEIVASINNNTDLTFEATTSEGGTKVLIQAKTEDNEFLQLSTPTTGVDAGVALGFPKNEIRTLLLYKNRELLDKNGRTAFVVSQNQFNWNTSITNGDTLVLSVDGTSEITYTFTNQDFLDEGNYSTVNYQNSLASWANVINKKVTGITAEVNGEQLKLTSNLGSANRASIVINPSSTLVQKGMFSESEGLSAQGNEADFELSRNTAQIKLKTPLAKGDSLKIGSEYTRAEITSNIILGGQTTLADVAYVWLVVDDKKAKQVSIGVTGDTFLTITKPGSGIVRYTSTSSSAFDNVQVGDYVIIWSNELSVSNRLEGRVHTVTSNSLDLKVTSAEESTAVAEGPILFSEGFTVIRTDYAPQKLKIAAGIYDINTIASLMNDQLSNSVVTIDNDEIFVIRTNTENTDGALFIADFNDSAKSLNFVKNSSAVSITSQIAFYESGISDKQFPAFIHGKITSDVSADPSDSYISSVNVSEDLTTIDPSGFISFLQPYNAVQDVSSTEAVEIQNTTTSSVNVENNLFYRRSRINDRFHVLNGLDFGYNDSVVAILDNNPNERTFNMPLYRTAITNISLPASPDQFNAFDVEGGAGVQFSEFFESTFSFDNYKCLMQAKNIIDPGNFNGATPATDKDAVIFRATEWGRSGEKIGIGYFYPTTANQAVKHTISVDKEVSIKIFLKSGASRATSIDGTTEWNITSAPLNASTDLVTYTYSGVGSSPALTDVISGDYVSIISTGEFSEANTGSFKVYSKTGTSFTIKRAIGTAVVESNIATLQNNTIAFFQSSNTTALDIVTYVNNNLSNFISAAILDDNGTTGDGVVSDSTEESSSYNKSFVNLVDGKNFVLSSNLYGSPQFTLKFPLNLEVFSTNTSNAFSFNNGETIKLVPVTMDQVSKLLNVLAVSGFTTLGKVKSVERNSKIQLSTDTIGNEGSIQIAGGIGNSIDAAVEGSSSTVGDQGDQNCVVSINSASANGLHSEQWVKVFASDVQRKLTSLSSSNSIKITQSTPTPGFSKIELFDRSADQRLFGRNKHHTRTRGRTFKVEKQGQFACISWDGNGTQPYFLKSSVDLKDSSSSKITIFKSLTNNSVEITVDSGSMRFDEVAIGDLLTISNRSNSENNGNFVITGKSVDAKTLKIINPNAVNELAFGTLTVTDNVLAVGQTVTVGTTVLTEGVNYVVGATTDDTASNIAAAISVIPNITTAVNGSIITITSDVTGVTIALAAGSGMTVSGSSLAAPIANTGDLVVKSEVQEGDSVSILSDFNILNRGIYRVVRRFKNSIYIENANTVEEEVTLANQYLSTGANAATNYDIEKMDGVNRLKWAGAGTEPVLELARPGDTLILGTDFALANQGEFHIVASGTKLKEITKISNSLGSVINSGEYMLINSANNATSYYIWFNVDGLAGDPTVVGKTGIEVQILSSDSSAQIATKMANKINNDFSSDFSAIASSGNTIVTTTGYGPTTDASNFNVSGNFDIEISQQGRRNFVDYINVNGTSETGIVIFDVLEIHREAIKFKEYEGAISGDYFVITNNFLGSSNKKSFVVTDVLSETEIIVSGVSSSIDRTLLDSNFNKVYLQESSPYLGYKKIAYVVTNPSNQNSKNIIFDTVNQYEKIGEIGGVTVEAMSKLKFDTSVNKGIDAYKYNTGLIAEANRIVYGDPRDNSTYPGVAAAGAEIFIKAPLVKRIEVSINIRVKTGIPFSAIAEEARNSVASLINSNAVGQSIPISNIISTVGAIVGVQAVAISSPQYDALNDIIRVNAGEKSLILDTVSDITVSKIE